MAAPAPTRLFERGDGVVDYWLAHADGFAVEPIGGHVEEVRLAVPSGRATALVVRRRLRRSRVVGAGAVAALDPARRVLVVETGPTARSRAAARARSGGAWLRPRLAQGARTAGTRTRVAVAWFVPRFVRVVTASAVALARLTFDGARTVVLLVALLAREAAQVAAGLRTRSRGIKRPWDSPSA